MPRPGFPRTLAEFQTQFATDEACAAYLHQCRWEEGFRCPRCRHATSYVIASRSLEKCAACDYQVSVTAGTVLHRTKMPLRLWFWAAYFVATHTPGISALQLQRQLGLRRYETAWTLLQKLRRAMLRPERDCISGTVEVDEAYLGGVEEGVRGGRQKGKKAIVAAAVEVRGAGSGRIRLGLVRDVSAASLIPFVQGAVSPGAIVITDGWHGYFRLGAAGYIHQAHSQGGHKKNASKLLPRVHRVFSNLKTWIAGTHHGISGKHLGHYLNEYMFRFNRRKTPMAAFQSLLGLATRHEPTTYKMLYAGDSTG